MAKIDDTPTITRKYSLNEIDRMREAVKGCFPFFADPKASRIEEMLRTYLMAGIAPEELEAKARANGEEEMRRMKKARPMPAARIGRV